MRAISLLCVLGLLAAGLLPAEAPSGDAADAPDSLHPSLRTCAAMRRDAERLICYDRAVARLAAGTVGTTSAPSAEELFGVGRVAREVRPEADTKREELAKITARVKMLRNSPDGTLLVELDNGQVWQQVSSDVTLVVSTGDTVTISRGALGTYRLATSGHRIARVKRVR